MSGVGILRPFVVALAVVAGVIIGSMQLGQVGAVAAAGTPLRQVDWRAVLASDPAITIDPTAYQLPGLNAPYVQVVVPHEPAEPLGGYALVDDATFADLDGDGAEEAIIPVASGGTAGLLGFLLYHEDTLRPRLVLVETGYKMSFTVEDQRLIVYRPNYVGFEPNCCPTSITRSTNTLQGDRLIEWTIEVEPNDVRRSPSRRSTWRFL